MSAHPTNLAAHSRSPLWKVGATTAALLAASFLYVQSKRAEAEKANPPRGQFVDVDGIRLHYIERGTGPALVLLHGNGVDATDLDASGLIELAARHYRVIAFDRPGFGHTDAVGSSDWTPEKQALLVYKACHLLGVERPVVLGHSWASLVALAMALDYPKYTQAICLVSGYFYPTPRADAAAAAVGAAPVIGPLLQRTIMPLLGRLGWHATSHAMFSPEPVAPAFEHLPPWMFLRPQQMGAGAGEGSMMVAAAERLSARYTELTLPVAVIAGTDDMIVDQADQSARLGREIGHSDLRLVTGAGHMVHYAHAGAIVEAISRLARRDAPPGPAEQLH